MEAVPNLGYRVNCGQEFCTRIISVPAERIVSVAIAAGTASVTAELSRLPDCARLSCGDGYGRSTTQNKMDLCWLRENVEPKKVWEYDQTSNVRLIKD